MSKNKRKIQSKTVYLIETIVILIILAIGIYFNKIDVKKLEEELEIENQNTNTTNNSIDNTTNSSNTNNTIESSSLDYDSNLLNVFYFDVGQADCSLIIANGKTMLIDAGNNEDGKHIVEALQEMKIEKLDYFIGTHIHEDHLGGADDVINSIEIDKIYIPTNKSCTDKYYEAVLEAISNKNMKISKPEKGTKFELGNADIEIMAVDNTEPEERNNASIVLEMKYENEKYLFMGDAEKKVESLRKWNDIDVLKVGHHGSNTSSSENFIKQVKPEIAVISVGPNNKYDLPKDEILERLKNIGSKIYRTDEEGTIKLSSDGNSNAVTKIDVCLDGNAR